MHRVPSLCSGAESIRSRRSNRSSSDESVALPLDFFHEEHLRPGGATLYEPPCTIVRQMPTAQNLALQPVSDTVGPAIVNSIDLDGVLAVGCYRAGNGDNREECPVNVPGGRSVNYTTKKDWGPTREKKSFRC
ncbi:hypothetical protein BDW62DRAFT_192215 [Aspergillus aurantiobrunneus]